MTQETFNVTHYWDRRYRQGRSSGAGSEGDQARVKADHVNALIRRESIRSVIDWGCGDGTVLDMLDRRVNYTGVDVSMTMIRRHRSSRRRRGRFFHISEVARANPHAELALSLDVIFHQIDDRDYREHMLQLFGSAERFVLIHSSDHDGGRTSRHVRWRHFTEDVTSWPFTRGWHLVERPSDPTVIGFYLYTR